jgi:hypothetical protein
VERKIEEDVGTSGMAVEELTQQQTQMTEQTVQVTQKSTQGTPNPSSAKKPLAKKLKQESGGVKQPSLETAGPGSAKSVNVMVPDKLPTAKLIMELESGKDTIAGATDLSGDTGAIGRVLRRAVTIHGEKEDSTVVCHELDLKGRIYSVTPVEFPGTIMVLNFTGDEARIESLTDTFIQLREDMRFRSEENEEKMKQWLQEDDDDTDPVGTQGAGIGKTPQGRGGKGGVKAKSAAAKRAPAKKKPAGAVKKPRAAKRSGGAAKKAGAPGT